jgi:hypothetical protein
MTMLSATLCRLRVPCVRCGERFPHVRPEWRSEAPTAHEFRKKNDRAPQKSGKERKRGATIPIEHPRARCREPTHLRRAPEDASQFVTICHQLKVRSLDGKMRETGAADAETVSHTKRRPLAIREGAPAEATVA